MSAGDIGADRDGCPVCILIVEEVGGINFVVANLGKVVGGRD